MKMAADGGDFDLKRRYAKYLFEGRDVEKDNAESTEYFMMMLEAASGWKRSQLIQKRRDGVGVPANPIEAAK
jgi:TPR repeat protein